MRPGRPTTAAVAVAVALSRSRRAGGFTRSDSIWGAYAVAATGAAAACRCSGWSPTWAQGWRRVERGREWRRRLSEEGVQPPHRTWWSGELSSVARHARHIVPVTSTQRLAGTIRHSTLLQTRSRREVEATTPSCGRAP